MLYIRPEELTLRLIRRDLDPGQQERHQELFGELQTYRHLRNSFSKDTPQAMLDEIDKRIAELEREMGG